MNQTRQGRFHRMVCTLLGCLLLSFAAHAEVGVSMSGPNDVTPVLYELEYIIDDPEPVGIVWKRLGIPQPHRNILNEQGETNGDGDPTLLWNAFSGLPIVAWARNSAGGFDVVISHYDGEDWTEPFVLAGSPSDELDPFLVLDPSDGTVHVLYWVHDTAPRVMHRQAPADLSSWSAPIQISQLGEIACRPAGVFHENTLEVVYEIHDLGYGAVPRRIALSSREDQTFVHATVATTQHTEPNRPEVHSRKGRLWVDWLDAADEVSWVRRNAAGGWDPVQYEIFVGVEDRKYHVRARIRAQAME